MQVRIEGISMWMTSDEGHSRYDDEVHTTVCARHRQTRANPKADFDVCEKGRQTYTLMVVVKCTSAPAVTLIRNNTCCPSALEKPYDPGCPACPAPIPVAAGIYAAWPSSESENSRVDPSRLDGS